jgi:hypothetical protein
MEEMINKNGRLICKWCGWKIDNNSDENTCLFKGCK